MDSAAAPRTSSLQCADGERLAYYRWPLDESRAPRATVLIVHGLGEHAQRYTKLAHTLNSWGLDVRSYDQVGHGRSSGARGRLQRDSQLLDHLSEVMAATRSTLSPGTPLVLLGHSMGGLVAARWVLENSPQAPDTLILSSPALDLGLNPLQKLLLAVLPRLKPDLAVGNGLDANYLSHDRAVVDAYRADPLVHDRISGRLARFMVQEGQAVLAAAPAWTVPTLLLYAGQDRLVSPKGSAAFAAAAPADKVSAYCFEDHYHEIFNEHQVDLVLEPLRRWLKQRFH